MDEARGIFNATGPGQNKSAASKEGLPNFGIVEIDGKTDLSSIIEFNDGGCMHSIRLTGSPGIYDYVLNVDAQGPKGIGTGSGYLAFTDKTGDTYRLSIYSSTRSVHTVRFNSREPRIIKIEWNNHSI